MRPQPTDHLLAEMLAEDEKSLRELCERERLTRDEIAERLGELWDAASDAAGLTVPTSRQIGRAIITAAARLYPLPAGQGLSRPATTCTARVLPALAEAGGARPRPGAPQPKPGPADDTVQPAAQLFAEMMERRGRSAGSSRPHTTHNRPEQA